MCFKFFLRVLSDEKFSPDFSYTERIREIYGESYIDKENLLKFGAAVDNWTNRWGNCSISSRNRSPHIKSHVTRRNGNIS